MASFTLPTTLLCRTAKMEDTSSENTSISKVPTTCSNGKRRSMPFYKKLLYFEKMTSEETGSTDDCCSMDLFQPSSAAWINNTCKQICFPQLSSFSIPSVRGRLLHGSFPLAKKSREWEWFAKMH
jgi:hypothetical protein